jgi:hypothetical protein
MKKIFYKNMISLFKFLWRKTGNLNRKVGKIVIYFHHKYYNY